MKSASGRSPVTAGSRGKRKTWPVLGGLALALAAAAGAFALRERHVDPTSYGPARSLELTNVRVEKIGDAFELRVEGATNLPDDARLRVEILATESVFSDVATVASGHFVLERREASRAVSRGSYVVLASFSLEEQSETLCRVLHYQPKHLEARKNLEIAEGAEEPGLRARWSALIERANAATDAAVVAAVASDVAAFERELWISRLTPAARELRRALESAASQARFDRAALRREVVKAEILASF